MPEQEKSSSLCRMARVMYAVMQTGGQWFTLSVMGRKLGLPPSTCHRYLSALVEEDMLEQGDGTLRYRLTTRITNLLIAQGLRLVQKPRNEPYNERVL
jgi:DNA-binding IclR family transcriptional regulator